MSHDPQDCYESGLSSCCSARIMLGGICSQCKEHCDEEEPEATERELPEPTEREFTPEQQAFIERVEGEAAEEPV